MGSLCARAPLSTPRLGPGLDESHDPSGRGLGVCTRRVPPSPLRGGGQASMCLTGNRKEWCTARPRPWPPKAGRLPDRYGVCAWLGSGGAAGETGSGAPACSRLAPRPSGEEANCRCAALIRAPRGGYGRPKPGSWLPSRPGASHLSCQARESAGARVPQVWSEPPPPRTEPYICVGVEGSLTALAARPDPNHKDSWSPTVHPHARACHCSGQGGQASAPWPWPPFSFRPWGLCLTPTLLGCARTWGRGRPDTHVWGSLLA